MIKEVAIYMLYDREKLLKIFASAPLYDGEEFHEGKNDDLLYSIDNKILKYSYYHGATKLAIIPKNKDYVIKIPYTGSYEYQSGYYYHSIYNRAREDYWEFEFGEDKNRPWDYCANEVIRYNIALENGFSKCFAKTELLGYINNYPIYIQERCITLRDSRNFHIHSKEENSKTSSCCNFYFEINMDWLTDFRLYYGEKTLINFIEFIRDNQWDDDLRSENIGYLNNRPVLIDYSGFLE